MQYINDLRHLAHILNNGPYAWPGGYPLYFVMADGETCSFEAIADNKAEVYSSAADPQWRPVAVDINWEDPDLLCAHTGKPIEAAYG